MAEKVKEKEEVKEVEKKPKPDCPHCKGTGIIVLVPGTDIKVGCHCKDH
jgi:hypothetical protein